jgi:hypothetical protein
MGVLQFAHRTTRSAPFFEAFRFLCVFIHPTYRAFRIPLAPEPLGVRRYPVRLSAKVRMVRACIITSVAPGR